MTIIEFVGSSIVIPTFAQDKDVVATAYWIGIDCHRAKVDIGVVAWSLATG